MLYVCSVCVSGRPDRDSVEEQQLETTGRAELYKSWTKYKTLPLDKSSKGSQGNAKKQQPILRCYPSGGGHRVVRKSGEEAPLTTRVTFSE